MFLKKRGDKYIFRIRFHMKVKNLIFTKIFLIGFQFYCLNVQQEQISSSNLQSMEELISSLDETNKEANIWKQTKSIHIKQPKFKIYYARIYEHGKKTII